MLLVLQSFQSEATSKGGAGFEIIIILDVVEKWQLGFCGRKRSGDQGAAFSTPMMTSLVLRDRVQILPMSQLEIWASPRLLHECDHYRHGGQHVCLPTSFKFSSCCFLRTVRRSQISFLTELGLVALLSRDCRQWESLLSPLGSMCFQLNFDNFLLICTQMDPRSQDKYIHSVSITLSYTY